MKRFVVEVVAFVALQAAIAVAVEWTYQRRLGHEHYLASLLDKERMLEAVPPPRVLLVGASSLAFGVDSKDLEQALGVPVRNLGVNAGLGLDLILRQAERGLRPGDRVLLSPEYRLLDAGSPFDSSVLWQALAIAPRTLDDLDPHAIPKLLDDGLVLPGHRVRALWDYLRRGRPDSIYWRGSFDQRGDFVGHLDLASMQGGDRHTRIPHPQDLGDAVALLSRFARRARAVGADVVVLPAPFPEDDEPSRRDAIDGIWRTISQQTGLPVLPVWAPDRSMFFDTEYHLTREGRRTYTQRILRELPPPGGALASGS